MTEQNQPLKQLRRLRPTVENYLRSKRFSILARHWLSVLFAIALVGVALLSGYGLLLLLGRVFAWLDVTPKIGPIDVPTLVTLLVVEGLLKLISRFFSVPDKPIVSAWDAERIDVISGCKYYGIAVSNRGGDGATKCQAQITLQVKKDDILNLPNKKAVITRRTFRHINEIPFRWVAQDTENFDLRPDPDRMEPLYFVRVVPRRGKIPFHFEIPSSKGWSPMLVALKPDDYEGKIKVSPMNGKPNSQTFVINYDSKKHAVHLSFPLLMIQPKTDET